MIEAICKAVYLETASFYDSIAPSMGENAYGYKILYGPPQTKAPILFLGYQPGGGKDDAFKGERKGERRTWPSEIEYATTPWPLARRIRETWGEALVRESAGLNSLFFRSPSKKTWRYVPGEFRYAAEKFSLLHAQKLVRALEPQNVVMIGFGNVPDFELQNTELESNGRRLITAGRLWGTPAMEVIHLSGARISGSDRKKITSYCADRFKPLGGL